MFVTKILRISKLFVHHFQIERTDKEDSDIYTYKQIQTSNY